MSNGLLQYEALHYRQIVILVELSQTIPCRIVQKHTKVHVIKNGSTWYQSMNVAKECSKSLLFRNLYTRRLHRNINVSKSVSKADQTSHLKLPMEGQKETNLPIAPIKHIMNKMQNRSNISLSSFRSSVLRFDGTFMEFIITCKHAANSYHKCKSVYQQSMHKQYRLV